MGCSSERLNSGQNWRFFCPVWHWNLTDDHEQGKSEGFDSCDWPSNLTLDSNRQFFRPCDREIWWMISKNNRALLLYHVKLCASFQIYWWSQTGFTVQKRSIRVEVGDMLSRVTLKFDGWPWKTIGHLFYATSSFEVGDMLSRVTLKFDGWPWKTIGHLFYATSSFVQHFVAIGEFWSYSPEMPNLGQIRRFLEPRDLEIWRMTLQNNRAPLLWYYKLCASFRTHWWIQTWVTVRKRSIQVKINDF